MKCQNNMSALIADLESLQKQRNNLEEKYSELDRQIKMVLGRLNDIKHKIDQLHPFVVSEQTHMRFGDRGYHDIVWGEEYTHDIGKFITFGEAVEFLSSYKSKYTY